MSILRQVPRPTGPIVVSNWTRTNPDCYAGSARAKKLAALASIFESMVVSINLMATKFRKVIARRRTSRRGSSSDVPELTFADVVRALERRAPDFASLVCRYVEQDDPAENRPEEPIQGEVPDLDENAWTLNKLRTAVAPGSMWGKTPEEEWAVRRASWQSLMSAPYAPPRLQLSEMMLGLYEADDAWSRNALVEIYSHAKLGWGLWKGLKDIYKLAEDNYDAEIFGVLACRLDIFRNTANTGEIAGGTIKYMRRRAWRFLRQLGQAMPEQFPTFACQVLRHYPEDTRFWNCWVASHIWNRNSEGGGPPDKVSRRAYDESWKTSADPLFRLLEDAGNDEVCKFAIGALKADFSDRLRKIESTWLARIAGRGFSTVDGFIVEILEGSPEFHQSKLAKLGLHEMVIGLLGSDNDKALRYGIDYCNAHAPAIDFDTLLDLAELGGKSLAAFVLARLEKASPADLGLDRLVRMLDISGTQKLAKAKLKSGFNAADIDVETYVSLATAGQQKFLEQFYKDAKLAVPTSHLRGLVESDEVSYRDRRNALRELGKRDPTEIGIQWLQEALFDPRFTSSVSRWLREGKLKGDQLDVDWLKGLVARPTWRPLALSVLGNTDLVVPHRIGSKWLLKAARHSDSSVAEFAHSYLLHYFSPGDFALEQDSDEVSVGVDLVFSLLSGEHEAAVRRFAASYLLLHHPNLGPSLEASRTLAIKPRLKNKDYSRERLGELLFDPRVDVRTFAATVARTEIIRWKDPSLAYDMASSSFREARAVGSEAVLGIGAEASDKVLAPPLKWLDADRVFAMAESPTKATREIALTLVRRHYESIGSAEKLAWLMDSPDREVRLFAVRLLWAKHRPLAGPANEKQERFDSDTTLREFVRTVLFGLPPGRMERRDGDSGAERPLPASVAKRHIVDVVREMSIESFAFAQIITPVLEEFLASRAKGEWHSCVAALAHMRATHPNLETALPKSMESVMLASESSNLPSSGVQVK